MITRSEDEMLKVAILRPAICSFKARLHYETQLLS